MKVSIVIVSYNSAQYIPNLFASLERQTVFKEMEIVVMDNGSTDDSVEICRKHSAHWARPAIVEPLNKNHGYAVSTNFGVERARGEYVFNLNADTWLEPDCVENLLRAIEEAGAVSAIPAHVELESNAHVAAGPMGFDIFGRPTWAPDDHDKPGNWHDCFMVGGAGFLIRRDIWLKLGAFDNAHFMYAEDDDISWKLWLAGYRSLYVKNALMHHRTHDRGWEIREFTRYLINRNSLLVIFKNAQHILLLLGLTQIFMLLGESLILLLISRSMKFVWNSYYKAIIDALKTWPHVQKMRKFIRTIRKRSDWEMARLFLKMRINRWDMVVAFFLKGRRPKMTPVTPVKK